MSGAGTRNGRCPCRERRPSATLGYIAFAQGTYEQADRLTQQALEVRARSEVGWNIAAAITDLGLAAYGPATGRRRGAISTRHTWPRARARQLNCFDVALVHGFLAILDCEEGRYLQAAEHLAEALPIWQRLDDPNLRGMVSGGCRTRHCARGP